MGKIVPADAASTLVKFCTFETGCKILESRALRWSAPHLFGDPFELHYRSTPELSARSLLETLRREALIMLFGPDVPTGRHNKLVNIMARWREQERFCDEEEADTVLSELLGEIAELQMHHVEDYMAKWRAFARGVRIACFSDKPGNLAGWERFAANHRGLALRFDCGEGTALPKPLPVSYQAQAPVVTGKKEQLDVIYGRYPAPTAKEFPAKLLVKGRHNQLEMEWRCIDREAEETDGDDSTWFADRKFPVKELRTVYLGAFMPAAQREQIARLVRDHYPHARIQQAQAVHGRYELEFAPC